MPKCAICKARKGKRVCSLAQGVVCSACCGQSRTEATCSKCGYYMPPRAAYRHEHVPRYSLEEMGSDPTLQSYAYTIEAAICRWDDSNHRQMRDDSALSVLEMLLERFHFRETSITRPETWVQEGYERVLEAIGKKLAHIPDETIARVISTIYFVAKRRSRGRREYLDFIHRFIKMPHVWGFSLSNE